VEGGITSELFLSFLSELIENYKLLNENRVIFLVDNNPSDKSKKL